MKNNIVEMVKAIAEIPTCQFASLTYLSKSDKSLARYTVNLGFSYHKAVEKSVTELEIIMKDLTPGTLEHQAAEAVVASLQKTLAAHAEGKQNEDYTKAGQYIPVASGLNINTTDNTVQLFGLLHSKVVLQEGTRKEVKSSPMTIAKNKIRYQLTVSKFREFALDAENVAKMTVNGSTIEMTPSLALFKDVGFDLSDSVIAKELAR